MLFPLKIPVKITSPYGQRGSGFHNGTDFAAPIGTPIYAPANGTVKNNYWHDRGGWSLVLDHGKYVTGYAHLVNKAPVRIGQTIKAGQLVGYTGSTGQSTGPHLHFTLRRNNELVDPMSISWSRSSPLKTAGYTGFVILLATAGYFTYKALQE